MVFLYMMMKVIMYDKENNKENNISLENNIIYKTNDMKCNIYKDNNDILNDNCRDNYDILNKKHILGYIFFREINVMIDLEKLYLFLVNCITFNLLISICFLFITYLNIFHKKKINYFSMKNNV